MFQSFAGLGPIASLDMSMFAQELSLVVLPFAHEDLAIILGGYIIVNELMPASLVGLSIPKVRGGLHDAAAAG